MTKHHNYKRVLVLGSGALKIGQAGEFDYSGSQALVALQEENIYSVLINPNISTIQTDEELASKIYFLPVEPYFVEEIIKKEGIDAIMLSFGGQTALNCGLALEGMGIFKKYGVKVLGTPVSAIRLTEDRHLFAESLASIQAPIARGKAVYSPEESVAAAKEIGFPVMMRAGFALGGKGSAIVENEKECRELSEVAFSAVSQILIEQCLKGWKEIEYEIVRDYSDNCIAVCNMENFDPIGIHTGESIVIAPSQTLDDFEYQLLRKASLEIIRHLGIVGECNIQFALNPESRQYFVIEVNARLSRSSALASKATGYPLAYVAAKIGLGYDLPEIPNLITKKTSAFFEPALDYIVCKFPRWDLHKFDKVDQLIGTEMKSVGEVMAIGRSFAEVIQKAIRMIDIGMDGLEGDRYHFDDIEQSLTSPTPKRIFAIANAILQGVSVDEIASLTKIDRFYLKEIERICKLERKIHEFSSIDDLDYDFLLNLKSAGFSDKRIAKFFNEPEKKLRERRYSLNIHPSLSQIDTLAAEYPACTNFLYFTYYGKSNDIVENDRKKILVLGSGCYHIGSSVEFDWCAVGAVAASKQFGYETIMLNCNPETVSTDYDRCDYLIFDEISLETILEINEIFEPQGTIVSVGGQTSNNLALNLHKEDLPILGTSPLSIDQAEDRHRFSSLLDELRIKQPEWIEFTAYKSLKELVNKVGGFPVLVRPSYVLSGAAMRVAYSFEELEIFLNRAEEISNKHPVVISKFEENAREIEFDGVALKGKVVQYAISEHVENAGVHSGDATLVLPTQTLSPSILKAVSDICFELADHLRISGPFNVQLLAKNNIVKVIECNLRASRSFPFVSKAYGQNFIDTATRAMLGDANLENENFTAPNMQYVVVKSPQFSFDRLKGTDPRVGVEMASTGEVACFAPDFQQALLLSVISSGFKIPECGVLVSCEIEEDNDQFIEEAKIILSLDLRLYASPATCKAFAKHGIKSTVIDIEKIYHSDGRELHDLFKDREIDLVVSIPGVARIKTNEEGYFLRRRAIDYKISLITDLHLAKAIIKALAKNKLESLPIKSWDEYLSSNYEIKVA